MIAAGLLEFLVEEETSPLSGSTYRSGAPRIDRATLMTTAEMKRGLGGLATIGATAPFVGLFGTVVGIINAFGHGPHRSGGLGSVSAGIAEALVTTAFGLFVAIPAVWLYNYFQDKLERFQVEMSNSSSELVDFFLEARRQRCEGWRHVASNGEDRSSGSVKADINVTPLVDVCLVLLIIFMVVTPLLQSGVPVLLPETDTPENTRTEKQVKVAIKEDGEVLSARTGCPRGPSSQKHMEDMLAADPQKEVVIKADRRLKYRDVREVMKALNDAGFTKVGLITTKKGAT